MSHGRLSESEVNQVRFLSGEGWSQSRIADHLKRPVSTVHSLIQRQQDMRKPGRDGQKPTPRRCLKCSKTFHAPEPPSIRRICKTCTPRVNRASSNME